MLQDREVEKRSKIWKINLMQQMLKATGSATETEIDILKTENYRNAM